MTRMPALFIGHGSPMNFEQVGNRFNSHDGHPDFTFMTVSLLLARCSRVAHAQYEVAGEMTNLKRARLSVEATAQLSVASLWSSLLC